MLTREKARKVGLCDDCCANLENGRIKCGAYPRDGTYCPRGKWEGVGIINIKTGKSGARVSGSQPPAHPKVEGRAKSVKKHLSIVADIENANKEGSQSFLNFK